MQLTVQESEMVKQSLQILTELSMAAEEVHDLRSEIAIEIYETCAYICKKSAKIVEAKLNAQDSMPAATGGNTAVDVDGYLTMMDLINAKINAFKQRYAELKEVAISEYKEELRAIALSQVEEETKEQDARDEGASDKKQSKKKKRRRRTPSSSSSSS